MASTSKKRKSDGATASKRPVKQPRHTIDFFFSPQVLAPASSSNDNDRKLVSLNAEQTAILRQVLDDGKNVFFTGSAGTGKSLLLRAIIKGLKKKYKTLDAVAVTASTGMAASNIGGMTIHAWGAVSPTPTEFDFQISCIRKCRPALQRWQKTKVLIIDEVSMVDGPLFARICKIAEHLRKTSNRPFGGIQLVITGDFFQLPPVSKNAAPVFAFECDEWKRCIEHTLVLKHVFRQKDSEFVDLLNQLRLGTITPSASATFKALSRPLAPDPAGILPTELFPLRNEVDRANSARLAALTGPETSFISRDSGAAPDDKRAKLLDNMMAPHKLILKVGAQVMLIKNIDERLVNGSVGKVLGFWRQNDVQSGPGHPTKNGTGPVRNVVLHSDGQTPVPRSSRSADKENASVSETSKGKVKTEGEKDKGKEKPASVSRDEERYPLVEFPALDGSDSEVVLLIRDEFRVEDSQGTILARRVQIPLILAWSISIHKSQGQTIHRVKIDLGKVFEKGQSYVALSRAASMAGLQVLRFDPNKVKAHPKVVEWNATLRSVGESSDSSSSAGPAPKQT